MNGWDPGAWKDYLTGGPGYDPEKKGKNLSITQV
jgi:hypothetical protein